MLHMYELNILIMIVMGAVVMSGKRVLTRIEAKQVLSRVIPLHFVRALTGPAVEDENQKQNGEHTNDE